VSPVSSNLCDFVSRFVCLFVTLSLMIFLAQMSIIVCMLCSCYVASVVSLVNLVKLLESES
jgi:hypothetical protein